MTHLFPPLRVPPRLGGVFLYLHDHDWTEIGAERQPNGIWASVWSCSLCPDIAYGGYVGPIPEGYCEQCGWVNRTEKRKCEECGHKKKEKK